MKIRHNDMSMKIHSKPPFKFLRIIGSIAILFVLLAASPCFATFIISGENSCLGNDIYAYHFSETASFPDFSVKVSEHTAFPDITLKLVDDPRQANLIFVDGSGNADMKVCKQGVGISIKTINVSERIAFPDITVKLSEHPSFPDYNIFIESNKFTKEEVAALFAVIWKANKRQ